MIAHGKLFLREQSSVWKNGYILKDLGVTFVPLTEVQIQNPSSHSGNSQTDAVAQNVYRPIMVGAEALIEGIFAGMQDYVRNVAGDAKSAVDVVLVDNIAQILRRPIDRMGRWWSFAGDWIGGYAVPTDITATADIIPTASAARYKRAVMAEIAS